MRNRTVKRVVDALATQDRVIVHLQCGHNLSLSRDELKEIGGQRQLYDRLVERANTWPCPICPDLPPSAAINSDEAFRRASFGEESKDD